MEDFIQWIRNIAIAGDPDWLSVIGATATSSPMLSTTVSGLVLLTAISGRSLPFVLASALSAGVALSAAGIPRVAEVADVVAVVLICVQLLLLAGIWGFRRRIAHERLRTSKLLAEKQAVQHQLDEEIKWRRASEITDERSGTTPSSTGGS